MNFSRATHNRFQSRRGFTLIEILIVAAIAAIVMSAAVAIFTLTNSQRVNARKRLERVSQAFTAISALERDVLNAGYHFPSARFAFQNYNNIGPGDALPARPGDPVLLGCGSATAIDCIVADTDVIELAFGNDRPFAVVAGVNGTGANFQVVLQPPGGPLLFNEIGTFPVLFSSPTPSAARQDCIGLARLTSAGNSMTNLTVTMMDRDRDYPKDRGFYGARVGGYNCPVRGMIVSSGPISNTVSTPTGTQSPGFSRRRYMIMRQAIGPGLYRSDLEITADSPPVMRFRAPELVIEGIDNMQVMPLTQAGAGPLTECNNGVSACTLGTLGVDDFVQAGAVVGVRISVAAVGDLVQRITPERPATDPVRSRLRLGDEPVPTTLDNIVRSESSQTFSFRNVTQVNP
jgi:prepilin-type N-terminal cleavage/methylation domain-containing protein